MKKKLFRVSAVVLAVVIVCLTVTSVIAATIYYYFGYLYTYINNEMVSLYGVEEETDMIFIPDTLNSRKLVDIRNNAFANHTEITQLELAGAVNLERIGSFAFSNCSNLSGEVRIPSNVVVIETGAFQQCSALEAVFIDAAVSTVPKQCFYGCTSLNNVTLNDSITSIGSYAFADCPALTYLEIPASVTEIDDTAFQNDPDITLGVYYNSAAHQYAESKGITFKILDPENIPEQPTEPEPVTEAPATEAPATEAPATEAPATEAPVTEKPQGYYLGDVDDNGEVEIIDCTLIQRTLCFMRTELDEASLQHGDVDGDGTLSIIDVSQILRFLSDFDLPYPIGQWITA